MDGLDVRRNLRQWMEVELDLDGIPIGSLRDQAAGSSGLGLVRIEKKLDPLILKPAVARRVRRRIGRQIAGLDQHARGMDAPDAPEIFFHRLGSIL